MGYVNALANYVAHQCFLREMKMFSSVDLGSLLVPRSFGSRAWVVKRILDGHADSIETYHLTYDEALYFKNFSSGTGFWEQVYIDEYDQDGIVDD